MVKGGGGFSINNGKLQMVTGASGHGNATGNHGKWSYRPNVNKQMEFVGRVTKTSEG